MIELCLEQEYAIDNATVAESAGVPESQVESVSLVSPAAMADGRMAIGASVWFNPKRTRERGSETFQIDLDASGTVGIRDLTQHFPIRPDTYKHDAAPIGDAMLYLSATDHALLVPATPQEEPYPIRIATPSER